MMANEPGVGRLMPQGSHAQSYMFVPSTMGSRENQKSRSRRDRVHGDGEAWMDLANTALEIMSLSTNTTVTKD